MNFEGIDVRIANQTEYFKLNEVNPVIGISHHSTGLGKLKVSEGGIEYGVPITDIIEKPLGEWRIERK